jgi:hypothetical protein
MEAAGRRRADPEIKMPHGQLPFQDDGSFQTERV